jgi:response regulator RpfG family c-di-GMP phosphodiesterase
MQPRNTILVVDDEPDVVKTVQELFRYDYRVLGANSGEEGLALLRRERVHVLMTDQRMPGMTGVELLRRAREASPDTVRILVTGYADVRDVIDAINLGNVYHYLTKPWDPEVLEATLRDAVTRYEATVARDERCAVIEDREHLLASSLRATGRRLDLLAQTLTAVSRDTPPHERATLVSRLTERLRASTRELTTPREPTECELAALMREVSEDARSIVSARHGRIDVTLADDLGTAEIDPAYVREGLVFLFAQGAVENARVTFVAQKNHIEVRGLGPMDYDALITYFALAGIGAAWEAGVFALTP